jgi:hypothetical protein
MAKFRPHQARLIGPKLFRHVLARVSRAVLRLLRALLIDAVDTLLQHTLAGGANAI